MNRLKWQSVMAVVTAAAFFGAVFTHAIWELSHNLMAPVFALIAAVAHSVTLMRGPQIIGVTVRVMLVVAVLFSAYHWLLAQVTETNELALNILATLGLCAVIPGVVVAVGEQVEANRANSDGPDSESGEPDGPQQE